MDRQKKVLFFSIVVLWGVAVAAGVTYFFFPYQKVLKIALQNVVGGRKAVIAMEGVSTRMLGIHAEKLFLKPDVTGSQVPIELSDVDISWKPFSLLKGSLSLSSRASVYDGLLHSTVTGVSFRGPSTPSVILGFKDVDISKFPVGVLPGFRGVTGKLNGVIRRNVPLATPDKQSGTFRFTLTNGEVKGLQIKDLPRLVIPYRQIIIEGKTNGPKVEVRKILLTSDVVLLRGSGLIESSDLEQYLDINLSYEALSKLLPLKGKGVVTIRGSSAAPLVTISNTAISRPDNGGKT
jgi:type II secretion system protein N